MVKLYACVFLLFGCTAMGLWKRAILSGRVREVRDLQELLQIISTQILYEQTALESAMRTAAVKGPAALRTFCQRVAEGCEKNPWNDFGQLWESCWGAGFADDGRGQRAQINAQNTVKDPWLRLGRQLGHGGLEQQKQVMEQCRRELQRIESDWLEELKTHGRMYVGVGACCGVFLTVLLF